MPWIVGGAVLIGGLLSNSSASKGRKASQKALQEGRDYAVNESGLTDYKNSGLRAQKTIDDLLGNNGGDTTASQQAFDRYLNSAGYRFQQAEGNRAITTNAAAKGMLNSGATLKAAEKFGQNIGASYFNSYLDKQNAVASRGANASSNLASIYSGTGAQLASSQERGYAAQGEAQQNTLGEFGTYLGDLKGRGTQETAPTTTPVVGRNASRIFNPDAAVA